MFKVRPITEIIKPFEASRDQIEREWKGKSFSRHKKPAETKEKADKIVFGKRKIRQG